MTDNERITRLEVHQENLTEDVSRLVISTDNLIKEFHDFGVSHIKMDVQEHKEISEKIAIGQKKCDENEKAISKIKYLVIGGLAVTSAAFGIFKWIIPILLA